MPTLKELQNRTRAFMYRADHDADLDAELATHLEFAIEENLRRGMTAEEARRQALIRFGGVAQAKEQQRTARGLVWLDVLLQDLSFTLRTLRRDRAFTIIAVLILALGIGANIAVFSVVNTILLRPLPFPNPQQLVRIPGMGEGGESSNTFTTNATQQFRAENHSFAKVSGYFAFTAPDNYKLTGHGVPLPVTGIMVADDFFETLGVAPSLGRLFGPEEYVQHGRPAVLLSHVFWQRQFGSNLKIIGQTIDLDGKPVTVTGVLPETFDFGAVFSPGAKVDVFTPFVMTDFVDDGNVLALVARLKPGVDPAQAQAEVNILFPTLQASLKHPEWHANYHARVIELKDYVSGKLRRSLIVLWCAVGMILLIVCVNLSNLLLARAAARGKEFAMRIALGAGRGRLIRQLLTESLVLCTAGAVLGLGIALAIVEYLAHQGSIALPLLGSIRIDAAALGWTLLIAVVSAVIFGVAPSLRMSGNNLQDALKDTGHGSGTSRRHNRIRSALVIAEIAIACVLLVGAGLLLRSFLRVLDTDLGFEPSHAASISMDYDDGDNAEKRSALWQEALRRVKAIPGVETAGITDNLPLSRNRGWGIQAKGEANQSGRASGAFVYVISPGYLQSIGMRLLEGRDIAWDDASKTQSVVIINQAVARALWPGKDALGRFANVGDADARVIGIVADVRESSVETAGSPQMFVSGVAPQYGPDGAQLVVRTKLPTNALAATVLQTLRQINPDQPATEFKPIQMLVDHAVSPRRFFVLMVIAFAAFGVILAALGIYGVISYAVTRQTKEIGIRMALGATVGRVQAEVLLETLWMTLGGVALGIAASLIAAKGIEALLYGTSANDPETFGSVILLLAVVALLAGYLPARRASRIDPMIALRNA